MITYGNGDVLFDGSAKAFQMLYRGTITITNSPDNLIISANRKKIIGVMIDGTDLPQELFNYVGDLRLLSCNTITNEESKSQKITLQGVDYWELDKEKWEDDGSLWGTRDGTYLVGSKQRFSKHNIVVNNNIKTQSDGQYKYKNGSPVAANTLIHIHGDGVAMTGGTHNEDSVQIYYTTKISRQQLGRLTQQIRQTTSTYTSSSVSSGGSGGSGGGGGY